MNRCPENPIIEPKDLKPSRADFEVIGVFNTAVARLADEVLLLLRVAERPIRQNPDIITAAIYDVDRNETVLKEFAADDSENDFSDPRLIIRKNQTYLTSISHLRLARSSDGISFSIDDKPTIAPANKYETFGIEDPRIALIDRTFYIHYVAVSPFGVTTCLLSTQDFEKFQRHGIIFCPENKDVAIFPEKVAGNYWALHRPVSPLFGKNDIWVGQSPDLLCWGNHRFLMGPGRGHWDKMKIGASAVPVRTEQGWLEIYHGVDRANRYCLGAVLLDGNKPWKVVARSNKPILEPQAEYEVEGFFGNVVFSCGVLLEDNMLKIYYGVADTSICYAEVELKEVIDTLNL